MDGFVFILWIIVTRPDLPFEIRYPLSFYSEERECIREKELAVYNSDMWQGIRYSCEAMGPAI